MEPCKDPIADPNAPRSIPWSEHLESALYHIPVDALPLVADALEGVLGEAEKTKNAAGQDFFEELAAIAKRVRDNRIY